MHELSDHPDAARLLTPVPGRDFLVVVSGLPGSGKSTTGRLLAEAMHVALVDKDTILEALFDTLGSPDRDARERLSRASDEVLYALAAEAGPAVLVNWWDPATAPDRLRAITPRLVEVYCDCPVEVAAARFAARIRHPGHHDPVRSPAELADDISRMRTSYAGPLGLGDPVHVDTVRSLDIAALLALVAGAAVAPA